MNGPAAIPLTEMETYCRMFGIIDLEERERFVTMIRALDATFLKKQAANREAERKKNGRRN